MRWVPDPILDDFECARIGLPRAKRAAGDPDGLVTATVVRAHPPRHRRALLYLHGWSDCFYQAHLAEQVESWGMDFHALDLRRYGRNLAPGQLAGWIDDLDDYDEEIDAAVSVIGAHHDSVTIMGHSTGGLTASLWVARHPGVADGLVLNSPWLDLQGSSWTRWAAGPLTRVVRQADPTTVLPLPARDHFGRAMRREFGGEWDVPEAKDPPDTPFLVRAGWLAAVIEGHSRVSKGLGIDVPVLTMISARSDLSSEWNEGMRRADTVLDVERLADAAVHLGSHLTLVRVEGGLHDLVLSAPAVRAQVFATMRTWVEAWLG